MTTDIAQTQHSRAQKKHAPPHLELTRHQPFVDGIDDLFDVLACQQNSPGKDPMKQGLRAAIDLLQQAQSTIESLKNLTTVDALTGLGNAQGLKAMLSREIGCMERHQDHKALLVFAELDNAGAIERKYGQGAVNAAIRLVATILRTEARSMDMAARISAHEFALLFSGTSLEKTLTRVQQLARRLNKLSLVWDGKEIDMSISVGLKAIGPCDTPESLLNHHAGEKNAE